MKDAVEEDMDTGRATQQEQLQAPGNPGSAANCPPPPQEGVPGWSQLVMREEKERGVCRQEKEKQGGAEVWRKLQVLPCGRGGCGALATLSSSSCLLLPLLAPPSQLVTWA